MGKAAEARAAKTYRARLMHRGFTRVEITTLDRDRDLIRMIARCLAEDGPDADRVRATMRTVVAGEPPKPGRILSALRRSPLVGAKLDVSRSREGGREVDL